MSERSVEVEGVRFDAERFWVELDDGRVLGVPIAWFPRLHRATSEQRAAVLVMRGGGMHWESVDEDIHIDGLLKGYGDETKAGRAARGLPPRSTEAAR